MVERSRAAATIKDAEDARDELRVALKGAGVTLPSLTLDGVSLTGDFPRPLLDLGRCTPQTARRLAEALRGEVG